VDLRTAAAQQAAAVAAARLLASCHVLPMAAGSTVPGTAQVMGAAAAAASQLGPPGIAVSPAGGLQPGLWWAQQLQVAGAQHTQQQQQQQQHMWQLAAAGNHSCSSSIRGDTHGLMLHVVRDP
jgi:hypothetical protein